MTRLADINVSGREVERGWLGMGRDRAEDDPSWGTFRLKPLPVSPKTPEKEEAV